MTSGSVDAISFIRLGQVFTDDWKYRPIWVALLHVLNSPALRYLIALGGFVIGAGIAR